MLCFFFKEFLSKTKIGNEKTCKTKQKKSQIFLINWLLQALVNKKDETVFSGLFSVMD